MLIKKREEEQQQEESGFTSQSISRTWILSLFLCQSVPCFFFSTDSLPCEPLADTSRTPMEGPERLNRPYRKGEEVKDPPHIQLAMTLLATNHREPASMPAPSKEPRAESRQRDRQTDRQTDNNHTLAATIWQLSRIVRYKSSALFRKQHARTLSLSLCLTRADASDTIPRLSNILILSVNINSRRVFALDAASRPCCTWGSFSLFMLSVILSFSLDTFYICNCLVDSTFRLDNSTIKRIAFDMNA